jgi:hypothetical protein
MERRTKIIALDQKSVGLADQDSSGTPIIFQKFDLAQLANGFVLRVMVDTLIIDGAAV